MVDLNPHCQWRLALARQIAHRVRAYKGIQAIFVGGSVARGYADRYSDLEIPLVWDELPSDAVRKAIVTDLGADFLHGYDGPSREDQLLIRGFQVDFWHNTVAYEETVLDDVLIRLHTDLGSSNFMDTVRACVPLYGQAIIEQWKERARCYPDALAVKVIREQIQGFGSGHLQIHARRDNPTMVYGQISELHRRAFLFLLALNKEYFSTFKWMYRVLEAMSRKPPGVEDRFRKAFATPQEEAVASTMGVLNEVLDLVDVRYPQIDTAPARERLSSPRRAHDAPPRLW
jgi:hypothetical protein